MRSSDWSSDVCSSDLGAACTLPPNVFRSASVSRNAPSERAQIDTAAPSLANPMAIQRPMPRLPPATTTRLPFSPSSMLRLLLSRGHQLAAARRWAQRRSEEHTSELQSLMRNSYAVFCLKKQKKY